MSTKADAAKSYCPTCRNETKHNSLHQTKRSSGPDDDFGWTELFEVIACAGCGNLQFRKTYGDESMVTYDPYGEREEYYNDVELFPSHLRNHIPLSDEHRLPKSILEIYKETLEAFKMKCYILAGVGFRSIIEAICIDKSIKGKDLQQKIYNLLKEKLITERECNRLHSIRFLGNDSVHEMMKPERQQLYIVLEIIEHLLKNIYLIDLRIGDSLDTIIKEYAQFESLLLSGCYSLTDGEEITVRAVFGKRCRRFEDNSLNDFTKELIDRINKSEVTWLKIDNIEPLDNKISQNQKFKVVKAPDTSIFSQLRR